MFAGATLRVEIAPYDGLATFRLELLRKEITLARLIFQCMQISIIGNRGHPCFGDSNAIVFNDWNQSVEMIRVVVGAHQKIDATIFTAKIHHRPLQERQDMVLWIAASGIDTCVSEY